MRKSKLGILASAIMIGSIAIPVLGQAAGDNGGGNPPPAPADNGGGGTPPPPSDNGGGGGGGGGRRGQNGGGGGGGNFQNFRQMMMDRMKTDLGSSDDEFTALQPKIEAVMTAQRDATGGRGFGGGGRRGGQGGGGAGGGGGGFGGQQGPQSDVQTKTADLRTVLENKDSTPDQIKEKLDALRAARAKAKDDLTKAQADLKGLLTQRQEAVLVGYGMLD